LVVVWLIEGLKGTSLDYSTLMATNKGLIIVNKGKICFEGIVMASEQGKAI